ncbi:hypothetical protein [Oceanobacillus kapialis]|uniref:ABC transporter permease n=1 Tax=Oceanobacillus kapialis TaxID=481353 RepID=A0ABW5Q4A9_9BACI
MNRAFWRHELSMLIRSKKNIIFIFFLTVFVLSYCFIILPNSKSTETFDGDQLSKELQETSATQRDREENGHTGFGHFTGVAYYAMQENYALLHSKMITAFDDEDFRRYVHLRTYFLEQNPSSFLAEHPDMFADSPIPGKDRYHLYNQTLLRYQGYLNQDDPITNEMIEEKTAVQAIQEVFLSFATYFIVFVGIYFSSDVLVRNRQNKTLLQGLPLAWYRVLNIKTMTTFIYTLGIIFALFLLATLIISIQNGFGSLNHPLAVMIKQGDLTLSNYKVITIGKFILLAVSFIPILVYLFIRFNILISLIVKNQWLVLFISSIALISEQLYFSRTLRDLNGTEISYFPQTYFDFGKIVTGEKNFLVNLESITYGKGMLVLLLTIVVIECILFLVSRIVSKRRFYQ